MEDFQKQRSWSIEETELVDPRSPRHISIWIVGVIVLVAVAVAGIVWVANVSSEPAAESVSELAAARVRDARRLDPIKIAVKEVVNWWDAIPEEVLAKTVHSVGYSNIRPSDYAGSEKCQECHQENYSSWSRHPHRWMNAEANEDTIKGDFSGNAMISYVGGNAKFDRHRGGYRMTLERDGIRRVYKINQTIGSRFFQYYIGKLVQGPEAPDHEMYAVDHVLPFGYWFYEQQWVPIVHTHTVTHQGKLISEDELADEFKTDPFAPPSEEFPFVPYHQCNQCHSTFPLGHLFLKVPEVIGRHAPKKVHFSMSGYLSEVLPETWPPGRDPIEMDDSSFTQLIISILEWEIPEQGVMFGIGCEACHMGAREHAENEQLMPKFFPNDPHLHFETDQPIDFGRTHENVNWICGRCHAGDRPYLAAGMATWNSTEYTDSQKGSCYSQLTCIDCHNPHEALGNKWSLSPDQDDEKCLKCHDQFRQEQALLAHTHHPVGNEGSRCMNCHMPRLNEGLQDVVRTHMIFSPTKREMIEANQPNACNLCHTDKPIDWTLAYLRDWYGASYSEAKLALSYPHREEKTAIGWLNHNHPSVRLIAADALARTNSRWAMRELIAALDDPLLLNRQFTARAMEQMLGLKFRDFGYRFFMTPAERGEPLKKIREALLPESESTTPASTPASN
jgi:predicted CXXCH cytochrome family protein